jgi:hypothetical protein
LQHPIESVFLLAEEAQFNIQPAQRKGGLIISRHASN